MSRSHRFCFCVLCAAVGTILTFLFLLQPPRASAQQQGPVSFINDVAPLLKENCFACHDAKKRKGDLDMTTLEKLRKGGKKDNPIVDGKPDESLLIDVLTAKDASRMPPKDTGDPLPAEKVALISKWIQEGAKLDAGITPQADLMRELRVRWKPPAPPASYKFPVTVTALAFTPDNAKLVVGGHHELTVWDIASGQLEKRIATRAERAYAMVFLPNGQLAVAGGRPGQEGDVRIYDLSAKPIKEDAGIAFLDGVNDKAVLVAHLLDTDDSVLCLALSGDGKKLAAGGCDRLVRVWSLGDNPAEAKLEQTVENHADWVFGLAFAPDGKALATCSRDKTAKIWDLEKKESLMTFPDHQNGVFGVAVKADGKIGYSVGADGQVRSWNATGEGKQVKATGGHSGDVYKIVPVPNKPLLITCGADKTVRIWDGDKTAAVKTLSGPTDYVYAVAVSPDGSQVAGGTFNGEVKVWKIADGVLVKEFNASPGYQASGGR